MRVQTVDTVGARTTAALMIHRTPKPAPRKRLRPSRPRATRPRVATRPTPTRSQARQSLLLAIQALLLRAIPEAQDPASSAEQAKSPWAALLFWAPSSSSPVGSCKPAAALSSLLVYLRICIILPFLIPPTHLGDSDTAEDRAFRYLAAS